MRSMLWFSPFGGIEVRLMIHAAFDIGITFAPAFRLSR